MTHHGELSTSHPRPGRWVALAVIVVAGALLAGRLAQAATTKPIISVLYFENRTGRADYDVLRKGLADMIVSDLAMWDGVTVVERSRLEAVLAELKLQRSKAFDRRSRQRVGRLLGAQYLMVGTLNLAGQTLAIDAQLIEVKSGAVKVAARAKGHPDRVFDLEQDLVNRITGAIDAKLRPPTQRRSLKVPNLKALLSYSKAIDLWDRGRLEEAHQAMRQVVSRSPTFLMARDRKERILKQLAESGQRRTELVSGAVVTLGQEVDQGLRAGSRFASLDDAAQRRHLALRILKGRVVGRLLRRDLSSRSTSFRLILRGRERQALKVMRGWLANQRRLVQETRQYQSQRRNSWPRPELEERLLRLVRDAKMGDLSLTSDHAETLARFVLLGRVTDGESSYTVAPALGDLDAKEQRAALQLLDRTATAAMAQHAKAPVAQQQRFAHLASRVMELKAEVLLRLERDEEAVAAYQKVLDAFPTSPRASWIEKRIKQVIGAAHDHGRRTRERWAKALKTCADMDIRVGDGTRHHKLERLGLAGLAVHAQELERACKVTAKNRRAFAYVYRGLAQTAATHEDCVSYRHWYRKYLEHDGSVASMLAYAKRQPWCKLGNLTKDVVWLKADYDRHWSLELDRRLIGILSRNGKVLTLSGGKQGEKTALYFMLDATGPGTFRCRKVRFHKLTGERLEGTCQVTLTRLARDRGDFYEGSFSAQFKTTGVGGRPRLIKLTKGSFRLRRQ